MYIIPQCVGLGSVGTLLHPAICITGSSVSWVFFYKSILCFFPQSCCDKLIWSGIPGIIIGNLPYSGEYTDGGEFFSSDVISFGILHARESHCSMTAIFVSARWRKRKMQGWRWSMSIVCFTRILWSFWRRLTRMSDIWGGSSCGRRVVFRASNTVHSWTLSRTCISSSHVRIFFHDWKNPDGFWVQLSIVLSFPRLPCTAFATVLLESFCPCLSGLDFPWDSFIIEYITYIVYYMSNKYIAT